MNYEIKATGGEKNAADSEKILAAVREFSVTGKEPDPEMAAAAANQWELSPAFPKEASRAELLKLICGKNVAEAMLKYRETMAALIPELRFSFDFEQRSKYHKYDVYEHTARAVAAVPAEAEDAGILRLTMLLHDIGKPEMFRLGKDGFGHFKGHAKAGVPKAREILKRLGFGEDVIFRVCRLIAHHSDKILCRDNICQLLEELGEHDFFLLLEVKKADNSAKHEFVLAENDELDGFAATARQILSAGGKK